MPNPETDTKVNEVYILREHFELSAQITQIRV